MRFLSSISTQIGGGQGPDILITPDFALFWNQKPLAEADVAPPTLALPVPDVA